jgi:HSP20 family protein
MEWEGAVAETRNDFIEELKAMKNRMEELFTRNFTASENKSAMQRAEDWVPMADIVDTGHEMVYVLDLPGVTEEDLQVECKAEQLWISGKKADGVPEGARIHMERPSGEFSRVFRFPCPVEESAIQAEFKKGVLRITVPKSSPSCRRQKIVVREVE